MALTAQDITEKLSKLISFLEPVSSLANSHLVSFFAENVWRKHVPAEIQSELSSLKSVTDFIQLYPQIVKNVCPEEFAGDHPNLLKFIKTAITISVTKDESFSKLLLELERLLLTRGLLKKCELNEDFMSQKKLHEVEITSRIAASVSEMTQSSHIVDIGAGKGYLSCILALYYSFKVLGLDSSEITTCGAVKRSEKVAKLWNSDIPKLTENIKVKEEVVDKKMKEEFIRKQFKQATTFVSADTNIEDLLKKSFNELISGITLIGLHTCGDLSSTSLRMFLTCRNIRGLVNVGCCYNHISEEFNENNLKENMVKGKKNYGFPMSNFLRKKHFGLGQNARMLAAYSLDRINLNAEFEFSQKSVFYRAVLEVVKKGAEPSSGRVQVGRLARKCNSFHEYMRTALKRLDINAQLTEDDMDKLLENYGDMKPYLTAFYFLRVTLAPVVESIILLDRILYLLENVNVIFINKVIVM